MTVKTYHAIGLLLYLFVISLSAFGKDTLSHATNIAAAMEPAQRVKAMNIATLKLRRAGRIKEALQQAEQAWQYAEQALGEQHSNATAALINLGQLHWVSGNYAIAETHLKRALSIYEQILGKSHAGTAIAVASIAVLYQSQGRYAEAADLFQRDLNISIAILGEKHRDTLISISNLATMRHLQGRYGEAESLNLQALGIREKRLGKEHYDTLVSMNNLAAVYRQQGRYDEAESLYLRVRQLREKILGEQHPDTLLSLNNLAALYRKQGRYEEAETLYLQVKRTREKLLGEQHPDTLFSLNNLASLYRAQNRYYEAAELYLRVEQIRTQILGEKHPDTLLSQHNLAALHMSQGQHKDAEALYLQTLDTRKQVLGNHHPDTAITIQNLSRLYLTLKQPKQVLSQLEDLQNIALNHVAIELATTLGESQKRRFLRQQSVLQDLTLDLALQYSSAEIGQFAATVLLRWNQVQGEEALFLQSLSRQAEEGSPVQQLAQQIQYQRSYLSRLLNQKSIAPELLQTNLDKLNELEVQLSKLSRAAKQHLEIRKLELNDVRKALPPNSALLALKVYRPYDTEKHELQAPHYAALLLPAQGDKEIRLLDVGTVEETLALGEKLKTGNEQAAATLYTRLFGALDEHLAVYPQLYIVPDHWLHLLNFERLKLTDGRYWIERQALHRLSNARDLLRMPSEKKAKNLVAVGGIDYGPLLKDDCKGSADNRHRSITEQIQCGFKPLPATEREAKSVRGYFNAAVDKGDALLWLKAEADEASLKKLDEAPRILHLATHGFYLEKNPWSVRPLVLSGLALAHANDGLRGDSLETGDGEDGILYALEVPDLALDGTELVTLSACDTGQGVVDYSEGVYGLLRAFRMAGARQVLMSLKKLDDAKAYKFMDTFYRHWLVNEAGESSPAAVLHALKLAYIKAGKPVEDWAAFVLVESR
ncbi:CHAT domain-containing protein [Candidatus Venteria ishoeyi]|uniref:CHAT domain-containing tetratricopeptide repeat protein n=1 Tax=Candidatus Venteria ishoeyi TaxID=1899563 RepID=UPI0025A68F0E|nr:CHAT domain-containing tetratricopeptide repeat protein [Candidatus Venteria ishoeyi]MDM8546104.1 CHAT domain-containing protein [Candidatus Venteria ishoeyi]